MCFNPRSWQLSDCSRRQDLAADLEFSKPLVFGVNFVFGAAVVTPPKSGCHLNADAIVACDECRSKSN